MEGADEADEDRRRERGEREAEGGFPQREGSRRVDEDLAELLGARVVVHPAEVVLHQVGDPPLELRRVAGARSAVALHVNALVGLGGTPAPLDEVLRIAESGHADADGEVHGDVEDAVAAREQRLRHAADHSSSDALMRPMSGLPGAARRCSDGEPPASERCA